MAASITCIFLPGDIARTVILVGDPGRVKQVSNHFESVEIRKENREFVTHTGLYKGKRITVLSTGIGTDNIDIVLNELDALVNVDLERRRIKPARSVLRLIRLGTSGALHPEISSRVHYPVKGGRVDLMVCTIITRMMDP